MVAFGDGDLDDIIGITGLFGVQSSPFPETQSIYSIWAKTRLRCLQMSLILSILLTSDSTCLSRGNLFIRNSGLLGKKCSCVWKMCSCKTLTNALLEIYICCYSIFSPWRSCFLVNETYFLILFSFFWNYVFYNTFWFSEFRCVERNVRKTSPPASSCVLFKSKSPRKFSNVL